MDNVTFSTEMAPPIGSGDVVIPGPLFQVGDYPDKEFSLTEAEADSAIAAFTPVRMNSEHHDEATFHGAALKDSWGSVERIWRDGKQLMAEYKVPGWLAGAVRDKGISLKTSAEWDRSTKQLVAAAWTLKPYLTGNELVAAFSANAGSIAPANPGGLPAEHSTLLDKGYQHIPLAAVHHYAAKDHALNYSNGSGKWTIMHGPDQAGKFHASDHDTIHDALAQHAASKQAKFSEDTPEMRELNQLRNEKLRREAADFASEMIKVQKAVPGERGPMIAMFMALQADDREHGDAVVRFNEASLPVSRVAALRGLFEARPPHGLSAELLDPRTQPEKLREIIASFSTIVNPTATEGMGGESDTVTEARRKELLAATPMGREVLQQESKLV